MNRANLGLIFLLVTQIIQVSGHNRYRSLGTKRDRFLRKSKKFVPLLSSLLLCAQGPVALAEGKADLATAAVPPKAASTLEQDANAKKSAEQSGNKSPDKAGEKAADKSEKPSEKNVEKKPADSHPKHLSNYKMAEPIADPAGSTTRVHRPGADGSLPPTAPSIGGAPSQSPMPLYPTPATPAARERFPSVGQLEQLMFGHASPQIVVDNRLDKLESAIFQKTYPDLDIEQRIKRLKDVVIGEENKAAPAPNVPPAASDYYSAATQRPPAASEPDPQESQPKPPFFPNYGHYDLNQELSVAEAEKFAVDVLNEVRAQQGLNEVQWDEMGFRVATEQVQDLIKREAVSHQNAKGQNPDVRYSGAGGTDSLVESTIMFPRAENLKITRDLVVKMLETLFTRQDDRECLMFPHASGFAMSFKWTASKQKLFCCTEVVTKHGQMDPIPLEAVVGDKIEIKGNIESPYKFHKITLAWESLPPPPADDGTEATEALPYFPPLDYEAHAIKSNKDFEKGIRILQIAGITAAIAGGIFIPPVALAAPLIAASVGTSTPKPVSEIPVKGGVKTDGNAFTHRVTLNNQGKEGIYYLTVWAQSASNPNEILPVSRRAIVAKKSVVGSSTESDAGTEASKDPSSAVKSNSESQSDEEFDKKERKARKKAAKEAAKHKEDSKDIATPRDELKSEDKGNAESKKEPSSSP